MINIHSHIFTDDDIPNRFLPAGIVPVLRTKVGFKIFKGLLHNLIPFSKKDMFDKTLNFIEAGRLGSQRDIFEEMAKYYPKGTKFVILPMDMAYMGAGKVPRHYKHQLLLLDVLAKENSNVIPFLAIDHRRPEMSELFETYIIDGSFKGIKMYPPLGTFPQDPKYYQIYKYCAEHKIPIMAHCTFGNPVHFKGKKKELKSLLGDKYDNDLSKKELCDIFTNPTNWAQVAMMYPDLKICLAHSGGSKQWEKWLAGDRGSDNLLNVIKRLCKEFDNMYMDISFTLNNLKLLPLLKVLLNDEILSKKILFGSDYYMNKTENYSEAEWAINFRGSIGEENFKQISETNNNTYLYG